VSVTGPLLNQFRIDARRGQQAQMRVPEIVRAHFVPTEAGNPMLFVLGLAHLVVPPATFNLGGGVALRQFTGAEFDGLPPGTLRHYDNPRGAIRSAIEVEMADIGTAETHKAYAKLENARLCLCMIRPSFVEEVAQTRRHASSDPTTGGGGIRGRISRYDDIEFTETECHEAQRLHTAFLSLDSNDARDLRVPMTRLSMAQVSSRPHASVWEPDNPAHQAIDLGIALEALLLNDDEQQELTYRFALRGAHLLGKKNPVERRRLFDIFSGLYSLRSAAVHRGVLPETVKKPKNMSSAALLNEGLKIGAAAIREVIYRNCPDLDAVVLG
jgi:hypothetical protein